VDGSVPALESPLDPLDVDPSPEVAAAVVSLGTAVVLDSVFESCPG
jgi:hypothetical protein